MSLQAGKAANSPAHVTALDIALVIVAHADPELVIEVGSRADDLLIPEFGAQQLNQLGLRLAIVEPSRWGPDAPGGVWVLGLLVCEQRKTLGIDPAIHDPFGR